MRILKILAIAAGSLVALLVVLLVAAWLFVDPNDYKDRIAQAVKSSTGRELTLTGDIKLSIFPWVALEIGPASLGNPAGFGATPFATVQRAALRAKLMPLLLRRQLQIGRIEIEGLSLNLQQNAAGKGNWEDFGNESAQKPAEKRSSGGSTQPLDLAGVVVKDSRISFEGFVASQVNLEIGRVAPGVTIPVKAALDLVTKPGAAPMHLAAGFDLSMDGDTYRLAKIALDGTLVPKTGAPAVQWKLTSPQMMVDIEAQTLADTSFQAQVGAALLAGHLGGSKLIVAPDIHGDFDLQRVSLRELMVQLGGSPPVTRDAKALSSLAARGRFAYGGNAARAEGLVVQLDDSKLEGSLAVTNLDTSALAFDLALDHIDLDRYLPPPTEKTRTAAKGEPFEVPTEALKPLLAHGTLTIRQAKVTDVTLTNLRAGIDAKGGVTHLAPLEAQLYGGKYSGDVTIDSSATLPALRIEQTMTGIDVAKLLADFADVKRVTGKGNVTTSLTATGRNGAALVKSLHGKVTANLADGAIEGLDLWYAISQAQSLIQKRALSEAANAKRTAFDTFKVSADIAQGVATTDDLAIASQLLRVTGKGTANLVTQAIDYRVTATVLKAPPSADANIAVPTLAAIPVNITGTFESPKVRPDLQGVVKARVQQELDKHKDEIEQNLGKKLKGLLGR